MNFANRMPEQTRSVADEEENVANFGAMTFSRVTLRIMTLSIKQFRTMSLGITIKSDTLHEGD